MKNLIIFLSFIGLSLASVAQNDTTRYTMVNGYGFTYNRLKAKAALVMPTDTVQNKLPGSIVVLNDTLYVRRATRWEPVSGGGAGIPSGGTTGQILAKDSDTSFDVSWIDNYTTDVRETVKAATSINKGQAVYVSGADGTNVIVSKASNSSEMTSSKTLGLLFQDLAMNGTGFVIISGRLGGLNTSGATAGDPVWLGTNGNLLFGAANKPVAPAHMVYLGVVTRVNANNGEIFVHVQNGFEIDELHDVLITDSINNQILAYDSTTRLWKNKTIVQALGYTPVKTTDTASMLSPYLRKVDTTAMLSPYARTATVNAQLATKVNVSDTASMLTPYFRKADTATLSNRINLKLNISDTSNMLSPYLRSATAAATYQPILTNPITGTGLSTQIPYFTGSTTLAGSDSLRYDITNRRLHIGVGSDYLARVNIRSYNSIDAIHIRGGQDANGKAVLVTSDTGNGTQYAWINMAGQAQFQTAGSSEGAIGLNVVNPGGSMFRVNGDESVYIGQAGSAPLFISKNGTTRYLYNSAGILAINSAGGNVGIGGDTPSEKLDITGRVRIRTIDSTASAMNVLYADATGVIKKASATAFPGGSGTTNYVTKWTGTNTQSISQIFDNGTRVGIGTAAPAARLDIRGSGLQDLYFISTTATNVENTIQSYYNNGGAWADLSTKSQNLIFNTGPLGGPQTERLRIFSNGRVGINTGATDNGYQLDVIGNLRTTTGANFATTSGAVGIGKTTPQTNSKLDVEGNVYVSDGSFVHFRNSIVTPGSYGIHYSATSPRFPLRIVGNSDPVTQRFVEIGHYKNDNKDSTWNPQVLINSFNGNTGIGGAIPTYGKFQIYSSTATQVGLSLFTGLETAERTTYVANEGLQLSSYQSTNGSPNTKTSDIVANADGTAPSAMRFWTKSNGSSGAIERMRISPTGDVGIGGTPLDKFTVINDANSTTTARIRNSDAGASAYAMMAVNASGNSWGFRMGSAAANSNALDIVSDALGTPTSRMRFFTNGRVGINTTTDAGYLLDVNGTLRTTSSTDLATSGGEVRIAMADAGAYTLQVGGPTYLMSGSNTALTTSAGLHYLAKGDNTYNTGFNFQGVAASDMFFGRAASSDDLVISTSNIGSPIERVRFRQNGNVGIGTATPADRLGVVVNTDAASGINISNQNTGSSARTRIALETQGGNWFLDGIRTGGEFAITRASTEAMRINGSGNIGIGTTTPTAGKVQIANLSTATMNNGLILTAADLAGADNGQRIGLTWGANTTVRASIGMAFENLLNNSNAYMTFGTGSTNTERMRIDAAGNVGIGIASGMSEQFNVRNSTGNGSASITTSNATSGAFLRFGNTVNADGLYLGYNNPAGTLLGGVGGANGAAIVGYGSYPMGFGTNGTERMRIFSNGRIFIGASPTDAGYQLDVNGNTRVTGKIDVTANASIGHNVIRTGTSDIAAQIFNSNGWLLYGAEGANGGAIFTGSTPYAAVLGSGYNRPLQLATNNTVRMEIDSVGLVGINTVTPTERLDVNGRARIRTVDSTATATNMLYVDNNGVVKKTSVPGTSLIMTESNATISTGWTFANNVNALNTNYLNKIEDQNSTYKKVTMQIAVYRTTSSFTTGAWQQIATLPADYAPTTTVVFELPGYVDGSTYYAGTTQFGSASEYTGAKVVRIDPSGNVQVRIGTVSASATVSGTNYVLLPINATWISTPLPL